MRKSRILKYCISYNIGMTKGTKAKKTMDIIERDIYSLISSPKARTCSNTRYGLPKVGLIKMALPPYNVFMLHNIQRIVMPEALPFSKQKEKLRI